MQDTAAETTSEAFEATLDAVRDGMSASDFEPSTEDRDGSFATRNGKVLRVITSNVTDLARGRTRADAIRLMDDASKVYVCVPHGYGDQWSYLEVGKDIALRGLRGHGLAPDELYASRLTRVVGDINLYLGSTYDMAEHERIAAAAETPL